MTDTETDTPALRGYADGQADKRLAKARKIEHLIGSVAGKRLLDLGAGSGLLSTYFASRGADVTAADRDTSTFQPDLPVVTIDGDDLPFEDASFDIVVFNHVIEHVGDRPAQGHVLDEISRILKPGGQLYIAVPNRYAPVEPHFRLPFLGALPRGLADAMVRKWRGHARYDCYPLSRSQFMDLLKPRFATVEDKTTDAFHFAVRHEMGASPLRLVPRAVARMAGPVYPTLIALATKA